MINAQDGIGLVLMWTHTRGSMFSLQMIFDMTFTNVAMYLRYGRQNIVEVFRNDSLAQIKIPSAGKVQNYKDTIGEKHPMLSDVWAAINGLTLTLQQSDTDVLQDALYKGWTHDHYVTSVL